MTDYTITFHRLGGDRGIVRRVTAEPDDLAQAVHRHACGFLGSRGVDVRLAPATLTGTVTSHGADAGDFAIEPVEPDVAVVPSSDPLHGYILRDLDEMAIAACRADRSLASDARTRYDAAWSAIALALAEADPAVPPSRAELVRIGWQAIYAEVREMRHTFGFRDKDGTHGAATAPRFVQYWTVRPAGHEEGLVERLAVGQVFNTLTGPYRDAVTALAMHGDYRTAADALGISYVAFVRRISVARQQIHALWFAPETPPQKRHTDRRVGAYGKEPASHCSAGHAWTPENTRWDKGRGGGRAKVRRCRACQRERDAARATGRRIATAKAA